MVAYPINPVRFQLQFSYADMDRLNLAGTTLIGQDFEDHALRTQIAF